jgi:hypothetical protein
MAERISLEIPATLDALPTLRMVVGGLVMRLELSVDALDDLYVALDELLTRALTDDAPERLTIDVEVEDGSLRFAAGTFRSTRLRSAIMVHKEACLDLCQLLTATVDEVSLEDGDGVYRVVLVKRRGSAA